MVGACCVGMPPVDEELRKVFAGADVASLDSDELAFSGMVPSTLIAAAAMRCPARTDEILDIDPVLFRLIAERFPTQCAVCL